MEIIVSIIIFGALFLHLLHFILRKRQERRARREAEVRRESERQLQREYAMDPMLLRGHDLVASVWFEQIRQRTATPKTEALVIAAATDIERQHGRRYEGRPIRQGWMTEADYQEYFRFLDHYGTWAERHAAIFEVKAGDLMELLHPQKPPPPKPMPVANPDLRRVSEALRLSRETCQAILGR